MKKIYNSQRYSNPTNLDSRLRWHQNVCSIRENTKCSALQFAKSVHHGQNQEEEKTLNTTLNFYLCSLLCLRRWIFSFAIKNLAKESNRQENYPGYLANKEFQFFEKTQPIATNGIFGSWFLREPNNQNLDKNASWIKSWDIRTWPKKLWL